MPDLSKQPEHQRRMADASLGQSKTRLRGREQFIIQRARCRLFLPASLGTRSPLGVSSRELFRRHQVEEIDIAPGDARIGAFHPAS